MYNKDIATNTLKDCMTYFMKSGTRFNVSTKEAMDLHDALPAGTYTVKFDKMAGCFYLEAVDGFEIKARSTATLVVMQNVSCAHSTIVLTQLV